MRRWFGLAVSSALLFLSVVPAPHHAVQDKICGTEGSPSAALITELYPAALSQDEYVVVSSNSAFDLNLRDHCITDGEGDIRFMKDLVLPPSGSVSISMNATSFERAFGRLPTFELKNAESSGAIALSGTFRLADSGDSLSLLDPRGAAMDCIKYGTCSDVLSGWAGESVPAPRQGEVLKRIGPFPWTDGDTARDWFTFREYRYGFTEMTPFDADLAPGEVTAFVSPDCSLEVVLDAIGRAERTIRLCSYELSSSSVCRSLVEAAGRGVIVSVLVDGAPAGGMSSSEVACLSALTRAEVEVCALKGNLSEKIVQHLGPLHCKYMVVDSILSIVLSENFVESGLPVDKVVGNRGWGLGIASASVSGYLSTLFDSDSRRTRPDVFHWSLDERYVPDAQIPPAPIREHLEGALRPLPLSEASHVRILVSPDASVSAPFLSPILRGSTALDVEQFQVDQMWEDRWTKTVSVNPLLEAVAGAMRDGASVRMIFDASWFNVAGNQPAMDYMKAAGASIQTTSEFRNICNGTPIQVVHNKGAIIDGAGVLISSNNWGRSSFARNRELAVLLDSSEAAGYFRRAFEMDWESDTSSPEAEAGDDLEVHLGQRAILDGSLSSDDRVVANYSWDLDDDGGAELFGRCVTFVPRSEGEFRIKLVARDPWGNEGTDSLVLRVIVQDRGRPVPPALPALLVASGGAGTAIGLLLARRMRPRKVNHPFPPAH